MYKKLTALVIILSLVLSFVPVFAETNLEYIEKQKLIEITNSINDTLENKLVQVETFENITNQNSNETTDYKVSNNVIKILSIGNSFSQDAMEYLYNIASSAGCEIIVGNLYYAGASLEKHVENVTKNEAAYHYYKWYSPVPETLLWQTMEYGVLDEDWDIITFQQSSGLSGVYDSYQPYLNTLINYVRNLCSNKNAQFALHMTWAYSNDCTHESFVYYNYDQQKMYESIIDTYKKVMEENDIQILIPSGTTIQNGRTNKGLKSIGRELTSDGYHLNEGMGRFLAGLTYYESLIVNNDKFNNNLKSYQFFPNDNHYTHEELQFAKNCVKKAIIKPFEITTIK